MYNSECLGSTLLLKWSKLLEYDFFRIYTLHLILYAPPSKRSGKSGNKQDSKPLIFRKNIDTKKLIDFMIELIESGEKTKNSNHRRI